MGFSDAVRETINALEAGRYDHDDRPDKDEKNLLYTGQLSAADVVTILRHCQANQYHESPHHKIREQMVDIFKPYFSGFRWYIKSYLIETDGGSVVFISVHTSESGD